MNQFDAFMDAYAGLIYMIGLPFSLVVVFCILINHDLTWPELIRYMILAILWPMVVMVVVSRGLAWCTYWLATGDTRDF